MNKEDQIDKSAFIEACMKENDMAKIAVLFNIHPNTAKRYADKWGCFNPGKCKNRFTRRELSVEERREIKVREILEGKHPSFQPYKLKILLYSTGLKTNKCEICGVDEWCGKPLNCELHHKDGNTHNHALDNLEIVCPNCHSQTDSFRFKRGKSSK